MTKNELNSLTPIEVLDRLATEAQEHDGECVVIPEYFLDIARMLLGYLTYPSGEGLEPSATDLEHAIANGNLAGMRQAWQELMDLWPGDDDAAGDGVLLSKDCGVIMAEDGTPSGLKPKLRIVEDDEDEEIPVSAELLDFIQQFPNVANLESLRHALENAAEDHPQHDALWDEIEGLCEENGPDCSGPFYAD